MHITSSCCRTHLASTMPEDTILVLLRPIKSGSESQCISTMKFVVFQEGEICVFLWIIFCAHKDSLKCKGIHSTFDELYLILCVGASFYFLVLKGDSQWWYYPPRVGHRDVTPMPASLGRQQGVLNHQVVNSQDPTRVMEQVYAESGHWNETREDPSSNLSSIQHTCFECPTNFCSMSPQNEFWSTLTTIQKFRSKELQVGECQGL